MTRLQAVENHAELGADVTRALVDERSVVENAVGLCEESANGEYPGGGDRLLEIVETVCESDQAVAMGTQSNTVQGRRALESPRRQTGDDLPYGAAEHLALAPRRQLADTPAVPCGEVAVVAARDPGVGVGARMPALVPAANR